MNPTKTYSVFVDGASRGELYFSDDWWVWHHLGNRQHFLATATELRLKRFIADKFRVYDTNVHFVED